MDKKIILWLAKGILIIVAASWLFYGNIYFSILMSPWLYLYIRENSKKIGNAQRMYFQYFFRELLNKENESYLDLDKAVYNGYEKYRSQVE